MEATAASQEEASREERALGASLSLDLDNLWCYQRSFGIADWQGYPSFLEDIAGRPVEHTLLSVT